jgi:hypothetical protein
MQKGVKNLEPLHFNLKVLNMMIYTCNVEISLEKFDTLSDFEKFSLLLTGATAETIVPYIRVTLMLPFLLLIIPGAWIPFIG